MLLWEQEAAGSNPAIPTDHSRISNVLVESDFPDETAWTWPDVALRLWLLAPTLLLRTYVPTGKGESCPMAAACRDLALEAECLVRLRVDNGTVGHMDIGAHAVRRMNLTPQRCAQWEAPGRGEPRRARLPIRFGSPWCERRLRGNADQPFWRTSCSHRRYRALLHEESAP